ncbi:MAG: cob(I)yrinic acid a,c-diamide adenosyltransferase [Coxiellaceae bacterium]|nr:cob(I)yrinic acid a,c-diamide adenosyltransferase [Coxiellaceae bacterium]
MVSITKVYTKQGDTGTTSLAGGHRIEKTDPRVHLMGEIDELNAHIAFAAESIRDEKIFLALSATCLKIQNQLFNVGASLAVLPEDRRESTPCITTNDILALEKDIDRMNDKLPSLRSFILPGGCESAARFHIARTVCRRAERVACHFLDKMTDAVNKNTVPYLNRLSDWLFVVSRHILAELNKEEILWCP